MNDNHNFESKSYQVGYVVGSVDDEKKWVIMDDEELFNQIVDLIDDARQEAFYYGRALVVPEADLIGMLPLQFYNRLRKLLGLPEDPEYKKLLDEFE